MYLHFISFDFISVNLEVMNSSIYGTVYLLKTSTLIAVRSRVRQRMSNYVDVRLFMDINIIQPTILPTSWFQIQLLYTHVKEPTTNILTANDANIYWRWPFETKT